MKNCAPLCTCRANQSEIFKPLEWKDLLINSDLVEGSAFFVAGSQPSQIWEDSGGGRRDQPEKFTFEGEPVRTEGIDITARFRACQLGTTPRRAIRRQRNAGRTPPALLQEKRHFIAATRMGRHDNLSNLAAKIYGRCASSEVRKRNRLPARKTTCLDQGHATF